MTVPNQFTPRGSAYTSNAINPSGSITPLQADDNSVLLVSLVSGNVTFSGSTNVSVSNFPNPQTVTGSVGITDQVGVFGSVDVTVSGSTGLMVAAPASAPLWVTGSVTTSGGGGGGGSSGPVTQSTGSATYPWWITSSLPLVMTGTVNVNNFPATQTVTGSVGITNQVTVTSTGSLAVAAPSSAPLWVTGSVFVDNPSGGGGSGGAVTQSTGSATYPWYVTSSAPLVITGSVTTNIGSLNIGAVTQSTGSATYPWWITSSLPLAVTQVGADSNNNVQATEWLPLATSTYCPTLYTAFGSVASGSIKASSGNVFSLQCTSRTTTSCYLQFDNTTTAPSSSQVPFLQFMMPAASGSQPSEIVIGSDWFTPGGINFSTGIAWGYSTQSGSFTAGVAANVDVMVVYK